jgi:hypothetical protein
MKTTYKHSLTAVIAAAAGLLLLASAAEASLTYHATISGLSALASDPGNPYSLDFTLLPGGTTTTGSNAVTMSNFTFTGGAVSGSSNITGNAIGDFSSSAAISLAGSPAYSDINQAFTSSTTAIGFDVSFADTYFSGTTPDHFSIALLDKNGLPLATTDTTNGQLLSSDILSSDPNAVYNNIAQYSSTSPSGVSISLSAETVPEPSRALLALAGFGTMLFRRRRAS